MDFDVIVIGSGFGATAIATALAATNKTVMILERGTWWLTPELSAENHMSPYLEANPVTQPVQYWPAPDHERGLTDFLASVKAHGPLGDLQEFANGVVDFFSGRKRPQPLYRYHTFDEAHVVTASGVGGGSLIYSNVTLEPHQESPGDYPVMRNWPVAAKLASTEFVRGRQWMGDFRGASAKVVSKYPGALNAGPVLQSSDTRLMGRARFLRDAASSAALPPAVAGKIAEQWAPLDLQVVEADPAKQDTNRNYCERQGRCFLGCNPAARHTLNKTYLRPNLPIRPKLDNTIFIRPLANVDFVEKIAGGYRVHYESRPDGAKFKPTATRVVLAAGTLGTTEILLRSREKGLPVSDQLGERFSTNGDFSGFVEVNRDVLKYPIYATKGPINMSHVLFKDGQHLINIEDAGIPSMFATVVRQTLDLLAKGNGGDVQDLFGLLWRKGKLPDPSNPRNFESEHQALMNVCWLHCMGMDEANGRFELKRGKLDLKFRTKLADHPTFSKAEVILRGLATAMNGKFVAFPLWDGLQPFISRKIVVTHPLGGCPIGGSSTEGVVNGNGQVYDTATGGGTVHPGLFVADGSLIPGPLAVNPTLTIVSLATRIAPLVAA